MNKLINNFEIGLFVYQIGLVLHLVLVAVAIYYILKNSDRIKYPFILILFSIFFPFIVSIPAIIHLKKHNQIKI